MRTSYRLVAIAALIGGAGIAVAAEQTILGKSFAVKNPTPDPTKRSVKTAAVEKNSPNSIVGNPTNAGPSGGGVLQVFAFGGTPTSQTFLLPQGTSTYTGRPFWTASGTSQFKYKDIRGENSAVKSVSIKRSLGGVFAIKAKISARNGPVVVVPPNPGTSACVALQIGSSQVFGDRYSIQFDATSTLKNKDGKIFKAKKPSTQGICPGAIPTTTTTSTTTTPSTLGTTTSTTLYGSPSRAFLDQFFGLLD
jgi:hypothetical protein